VDTKTLGIALEKVSDAGTFEGYGAIFSNVDAGGDRIVKGAFRDTLPAFRAQRALIAWAHDQSRPVAFVTDIFEDDVGLFVRATFHSTQSAQEARTVVLERQKAGLSYGLSIGYGILPAGARATGAGVRELTKLELLEISLVALPMNSRALVTAAKARTIDGERQALELEALRFSVFEFLQRHDG